MSNPVKGCEIIKGTFNISIQDWLLHINLFKLYIFWHINCNFFDFPKFWRSSSPPCPSPCYGPVGGNLAWEKFDDVWISRFWCPRGVPKGVNIARNTVLAWKAIHRWRVKMSKFWFVECSWPWLIVSVLWKNTCFSFMCIHVEAYLWG